MVPTLGRDRCLTDCLASLAAQSYANLRVVVVDNSGCGALRALGPLEPGVEVIENSDNAGFGKAVNQGFRAAPADYLATLNDDAVADPEWLSRLVAALDAHPEAGMAACRIELAGTGGRMDSAGLLVARDGSSKQRGHGSAAAEWQQAGEVLGPSGCAALYRARMLNEVGLFAEDFFLYCEDTDLALRGQWAGWSCRYVPDAVVEHRYSQSAGRASARKAWFVERNRLRLALRCFPAGRLAAVPWAAVLRYLYHVVYLLRGQGKAAEFERTGLGRLALPAIVVRAHLDLLTHLGELWRQRRQVASTRRVSASAYGELLRRNAISLRQVAAL